MDPIVDTLELSKAQNSSQRYAIHLPGGPWDILGPPHPDHAYWIPAEMLFFCLQGPLSKGWNMALTSQAQSWSTAAEGACVSGWHAASGLRMIDVNASQSEPFCDGVKPVWRTHLSLRSFYLWPDIAVHCHNDDVIMMHIYTVLTPG